MEQTLAKIKERFPSAVQHEEEILSGFSQITLAADSLIDVLQLVRDDFPMFLDITAADYLEVEPFFHVIYSANSPETNTKFFCES